MTDQKPQKTSALVGWDNAPASKMGQPGRDVNNNSFPPLKAATNSIMTAMAKSMMASTALANPEANAPATPGHSVRLILGLVPQDSKLADSTACGDGASNKDFPHLRYATEKTTTATAKSTMASTVPVHLETPNLVMMDQMGHKTKGFAKQAPKPAKATKHGEPAKRVSPPPWKYVTTKTTTVTDKSTTPSHKQTAVAPQEIHGSATPAPKTQPKKAPAKQAPKPAKVTESGETVQERSSHKPKYATTISTMIATGPSTMAANG
jgi:hypothetical protein